MTFVLTSGFSNLQVLVILNFVCQREKMWYKYKAKKFNRNIMNKTTKIEIILTKSSNPEYWILSNFIF